ncbi:regulatory protein CsrD [Catenovulum agarivorans DS-2]|uniref:Regulatory protein CsrD n=1 Tax=Catenovulum agarivorans DS-2 TaxID=1328313 RepID=W7QII7_9ALTE|nr:EAL domain-containing protein [Catenovulum agarivorans]EWH08737.1 regulatory protein CsrD [Catenovulum agarivorans DS-2]
MTALPLKTIARTLHTWQQRLAVTISLFVIFFAAIWGFTIAQSAKQHSDELVTSILQSKPDVKLTQLPKLLTASNSIVAVVNIKLATPTYIRPNVWLNWTGTTRTFRLQDGQTFKIKYLILSGKHIILLITITGLFWLCALLLAWAASKNIEKKLYQTERKARRLFQSNRNQNNNKHPNLFDVLDVLLDELAIARTEQNRVDKFIRAQTFLDPELGIGNRVFFENRLEALLNIEEQVEQGFVIGLRIDDFDQLVERNKKSANEMLGQFTQILEQSLKRHPTALLARYSQRDLAILLTNVSVKDIELLCKHILRALAHVRVPPPLDPESLYHMGVASFRSGDQLTQVLLEADMAIRAAQLQGGINWFMYQEQDKVKTVTMGSLQWRTLLERTLMQNGFILYFQSVIQHQPRTVHHQEVLVRVKDNDGKILKASLFMPMAQKCGLITQIDKQVVLKLIRLFEQDTTSEARYSINLAQESLLDHKFKQWFLNELSQNPKHAQRLMIEVSEYTIVEHSEELSLFLQQLDKLHVGILVDQVGQYVLSSEYIKHHPISYLKLHSSIVRNIQSKSENQLFIRSLQGTCADTSVKIFAFGLETEAEWQTLKQLNLAGAQGQYFNLPEANLSLSNTPG